MQLYNKSSLLERVQYKISNAVLLEVQNWKEHILQSSTARYGGSHVIPAPERRRQDDCHKFEASLGYTVRLCLKEQKGIKKKVRYIILLMSYGW